MYVLILLFWVEVATRICEIELMAFLSSRNLYIYLYIYIYIYI